MTLNFPIENESSEALPKVSESVAQASLYVLQLAEKKGERSLESVVLARLLKALPRLLSHSELLGKAASASTDLESMVTLLMEPSILRALSEDDPLAPARLRGLKVKQAIMQAEGGCISAQEAAKLTQATPAAVSKARKEGRLIGLSTGQNGWIYPRWQFTESGGYLPGLKEIIGELRELGAWGQTMFILQRNYDLSDKAPLYFLRRGEVDKVLGAAREYGEQGAP